MKNSQKKQANFSFEKFNNTLNEKQLKAIFGGDCSSNNFNLGGGTGIIGVPIIIGCN